MDEMNKDKDEKAKSDPMTACFGTGCLIIFTAAIIYAVVAGLGYFQSINTLQGGFKNEGMGLGITKKENSPQQLVILLHTITPYADGFKVIRETAESRKMRQGGPIEADLSVADNKTIYKSKVVIPLIGKSDTITLYIKRGHGTFHNVGHRKKTIKEEWWDNLITITVDKNTGDIKNVKFEGLPENSAPPL